MAGARGGRSLMLASYVETAKEVISMETMETLTIVVNQVAMFSL